MEERIKKAVLINTKHKLKNERVYLTNLNEYKTIDERSYLNNENIIKKYNKIFAYMFSDYFNKNTFTANNNNITNSNYNFNKWFFLANLTLKSLLFIAIIFKYYK